MQLLYYVYFHIKNFIEKIRDFRTLGFIFWILKKNQILLFIKST